MAKDLPLDVYIAAYSDPDAAKQDMEEVKRLAKEKVISIDALVSVRRDADGKIHVKDVDHGPEIGAAVGLVGGALVGLLFPPALLITAVAGAGIGAGAGAVVDQVDRHGIKADVENILPPGSSAIVAVVEERWVAEVEKALAKAEKREKHHAHSKTQDDAAAASS